MILPELLLTDVVRPGHRVIVHEAESRRAKEASARARSKWVRECLMKFNSKGSE
jgi:hypothetical protein